MKSPVLELVRLGFPWATIDPFLFCVHHDDAYPRGNDAMGPDASLAGRTLGNDFVVRDGYRMYHGTTVPGFPQHPHRGFETVTIARRGYIDHSDSLGAAARFGKGDVQWMTAGRGVVHSEMFPLRERDAGNRVELFQIWLNLPAADKMADPYFAMLWGDELPRERVVDANGNATEIVVVAGRYGDLPAPPSPPPRSWAARADSDVAIWTLELEPNAVFALPAAKPDSQRMLYFFEGESVSVGGTDVPRGHAARLAPDATTITNGPARTELLLLQGKPIGEPVVQYGPFVMNSAYEIQRAIVDYQRTQFGGWPWPSDDPVHPREQGRFARHADGKVEERG